MVSCATVRCSDASCRAVSGATAAFEEEEEKKEGAWGAGGGRACVREQETKP